MRLQGSTRGIFRAPNRTSSASWGAGKSPGWWERVHLLPEKGARLPTPQNPAATGGSAVEEPNLTHPPGASSPQSLRAAEAEKMVAKEEVARRAAAGSAGPRGHGEPGSRRPSLSPPALRG